MLCFMLCYRLLFLALFFSLFFVAYYPHCRRRLCGNRRGCIDCQSQSLLFSDSEELRGGALVSMAVCVEKQKLWKANCYIVV